MNSIARNIILLLASFAIAVDLAFTVERWAESQASPTLGTVKGIEVFALLFVACACFLQDIYEKALNLYLLNRLHPNGVIPPKFNLVTMLVFGGTALISGRDDLLNKVMMRPTKLRRLEKSRSRRDIHGK